MAKNLHDWSTTDGSNNFAVPDGAPENWQVGQMNNWGRAIMGVLARFDRDNDGSLTTAGTSTAYTVALNQVNISAWFNGLRFRANVHTASGATPTINPTPSGGSALGAKSLYWRDGTQVNSDLTTGEYDFVYLSSPDKVYALATKPTTVTGGTGITVTANDIAFAPSELTDVALATGDQVVIADASDSNNPKTATASDFQSLFAAAASDMETATSTTLNTTPGLQHRHPGHPKAWGYITMSGGTPTLQTSYGTTSITDTNTGRVTVNLSITLSSTNYAVIVSIDQDDTQRLIAGVVSKGTTSFEIKLFSTGGTLSDGYAGVQYAVFGDI